MDEKRFDELMDGWAAREMEAAPEISPTPEIYRRLARKKAGGGRRPFPWSLRLAAAGAAGAAVILFIVLRTPEQFRPSLGVRQGYAEAKAEAGEVLREEVKPAEESMKPAAPASFRARRSDKDDKGLSEMKKGRADRISFQVQRGGRPDVQEFDAVASQDEVSTISPEDNIRISIELLNERYVYVFAVGPDFAVTEIFPDPDAPPGQNPLAAETTHLIPPPPLWLHAHEGQEEISLYILTSGIPIVDLDDFRGEYGGAKKSKGKKASTVRLLDEVNRLAGIPESGTALHVFKLKIR